MENKDYNGKEGQIESLLDLWEQGITSSAQEQELRDYFISSEAIPKRWASYKVLFCGFASLSQDKITVSYNSANYKRGIFRSVAKYLAAAAVVAGIYFSINMLRTPYCYINGKPIRNAELAMQAVGGLSHLSRFDEPIDALERLGNIPDDKDDNND